MSPHATAPRPPLATPTLWAIRLLALVAVGLAGWLSYSALTQTKSLGCSAGTLLDCDAVLASSWATVVGIPVAYLGAGSYLAIFLFSWLAGARNPRAARWGVMILAVLAVAAAAAALWFVGLQALRLGTFCPRCLGVHVCGLLIAPLLLGNLLLSAYRARDDAQPVSHLQSMLAVRSAGRADAIPTAAISGFAQLIPPVVLGLAGTAGLIGVQFFLPDATHEIAKASALDQQIDLTADAAESSKAAPEEHVVHRPSADLPLADAAFRASEQASARAEEERATATFDDPDEETLATAPEDEPSRSHRNEENSRVLLLYGEKIRLDMQDQAYIGSPDAEHVVLELFDYTCPHCRKVHKQVVRARRRYGKQLAFITMPVPLELRCNKMLKTARPKNRGACKLAALALATASQSSDAFARLHYWMMSDPDRSASYDRALVRAYDDVGRSRLRAALNDPEIEERIQRHINLFANLSNRWEGEKNFGMPVFVAGEQLSAGAFDYDGDFFDFLEESTGMKPLRSGGR